MKQNVQVMDRAGDLGGEKIAMQIDAAATAHIMQVLTDLYSDPVLAVIREYSTNAVDSHIMAGVTRPIEVSTPSSLSPTFKVKDYGLGLDVEDIRQIYSQYGASTKRSSDLVNGILGLGCKSALTYTNQFTVTSVKDGLKTIVSVSRVEDGTGQMEVVEQRKVTEGNSTEIAVPVARLGWANTFETKAKHFFMFWQPGTVLLDGKDPSGLPPDSKEIASGIFMVPGWDEDYVVMGNVPYPVETGLYTDYRNGSGFGVVAFVAMGAVNFTPAREKLFMSDLTKKEMTRVKNDFKAGLMAVMRKDIEQAPSHAEALKRYRTWQSSLGININVKYQGLDIPKEFAPKVSAAIGPVTTGRYAYSPTHNNPVIYTYDVGAYRYAISTKQSVNDRTVEQSVIVTDFTPGDSITVRHREKMKDWAQQNGHAPSTFILTADSEFASPWVDVPTLTWADLRAHRLPKSATIARAKRKAKYDVVNPADGSITESDNITTSVILYVGPTEDILKRRVYGRWENNDRQSRKTLTDAFQTASLVVLAANRWVKFKRDYPNAIHVKDYAKTHLNDAFKALSADELMWLGMENYSKSSIANLPAKEILDPEVRKFVEIASMKGTKAIQAYIAARDLGKKFHITVSAAASVPNPLQKYTLYRDGHSAAWIRHTVVYLNAAYNTWFVKP